MTFELKLDSALESQYAGLGLESGFIQTLKDYFTIGRDARRFDDVKTYSTLKQRDIHVASKACKQYLDTVGYMNARPIRLLRPPELNKDFPTTLQHLTAAIAISDEEFVKRYVTPFKRLLGVLINNTSKLNAMSPIAINKTYDFAKVKSEFDDAFNSFKACLGKADDGFSTFGDLYPNSAEFMMFGLNLRSVHGELTSFNLGNVNTEINEAYELINDLYSTIKADSKIKVSKTVGEQIQEMATLMSAAGDFYVTCAQQYRLLISSHNEHIVRIEEIAKETKKNKK